MDGINIELRRSNRRTMSLEITRDAKVIVRAPYRVPTAAIKRFVGSKMDWIEQKLQEVAAQNEQRQHYPGLTEEQIKELTKKALEILPKRTAYFASVIGVDYGRITIRHQKTRWGSCSSKGNLNFNCLLMLTPPEIQDYVVVHELCHRKEMNHSAKFWHEVEEVLPDYKERRKWLKENGDELIQGIE